MGRALNHKEGRLSTLARVVTVVAAAKRLEIQVVTVSISDRVGYHRETEENWASYRYYHQHSCLL